MACADSDARTDPVCVLVLGMAGSGKTSLVSRLTSHLYSLTTLASVSKAASSSETASTSASLETEQSPSATMSAESRLIPYVINCDPAVREVHYPCQIDIRDTVKYKEVMKQYQLGPNGAIITSLNLFATKFDQVMKLLDKRRHQHECVLNNNLEQ